MEENKAKRVLTMEKMDYKKAFRALYLPKTEPALIEVPPMVFLEVEGQGDPNETNGSYAKALELLYALSYTIKMAPRGGQTPQGYFEYTVPPLEGLWWQEDGKLELQQKDKFCWISMIRQPEFVTPQVLAEAVDTVKKKKPQLAVQNARLSYRQEGLCVQCMHLGPYDEEPETLHKMEGFMAENRLQSDICEARRHHEIYLSDPRKTKPEKLRTVLRCPVRSME